MTRELITGFEAFEKLKQGLAVRKVGYSTAWDSSGYMKLDISTTCSTWDLHERLRYYAKPYGHLQNSWVVNDHMNIYDLLSKEKEWEVVDEI